MMSAPIQEIVRTLVAAADAAELSKAARRTIISNLRRAILPRKPPVRKKSTRLDSAFADYKSGVRGMELHKKHIPNFSKLSRWRRVVEGSRLNKALSKRAERERKRARRPAETDLSTPTNSHPVESTFVKT
jgi:hypothetical protein